MIQLLQGIPYAKSQKLHITKPPSFLFQFFLFRPAAYNFKMDIWQKPCKTQNSGPAFFRRQSTYKQKISAMLIRRQNTFRFHGIMQHTNFFRGKSCRDQSAAHIYRWAKKQINFVFVDSHHLVQTKGENLSETGNQGIFMKTRKSRSHYSTRNILRPTPLCPHIVGG